MSEVMGNEERRLFDYFYDKEQKEKLQTDYLKCEVIKRTQHFVLEADWYDFVLQVANSPNSNLLKALPLVRLPYPTVWVEYDIPEEHRASVDSAIKRGMLITRGETDHQFRIDTFSLWPREGKDSELQDAPLSLFLDLAEDSLATRTLAYSKTSCGTNAIASRSWLSRLNSQLYRDMDLICRSAFCGFVTRTVDDKQLLKLNFDLSGWDEEVNKLAKTICIFPNEPYELVFDRIGEMDAEYRNWIRRGGDPQVKTMAETARIRAEMALSAEVAGHHARIILATLALLNCRNLLDKDTINRTDQNEIRRKAGLPKIGDTYHVLKIHPSRSQQGRIGLPGGHRDLRAHLVRGHFKRKKHGIYWWNPFFRGNEGLGFVHKDYEVEE